MVLKAILKSACIIQAATSFVEEQATVVALQLGKGRSNDSTLSANSKSSRRSKSTKSSEAASGDLEKKSKKRRTSKKHKSSKKSNTDKDEAEESNEVCGTSCDWLNVFDSKTEEGKSDEAVMYRGCIIFWLTATLIPAVVGIVTCASGGSCMCCEETEMDKAVRMRKAEQAARSSAFESRGEENRASNSNGAPVAAASPFDAASAPFAPIGTNASALNAAAAKAARMAQQDGGISMATAVTGASAPPPTGSVLKSFSNLFTGVNPTDFQVQGDKATMTPEDQINFDRLNEAHAAIAAAAPLAAPAAQNPGVPLAVHEVNDPFVLKPVGKRPTSSCTKANRKGQRLAAAQHNWDRLNDAHEAWKLRHSNLVEFLPPGKKPDDKPKNANALKNFHILDRLSRGLPLIGESTALLSDQNEVAQVRASNPNNPFVPTPWPVTPSCGRRSVSCCKGPTKAMQNFTLLQDKHDAREWETPAQAAVVSGPAPVAGATVQSGQVPHAAGIPVDPAAAAAGGSGSPVVAAAAAVAGNNGQPGDDERPPGRCPFSRCCRGRSGRGRRQSAGNPPVMGHAHNGVNLAPQAGQPVNGAATGPTNGGAQQQQQQQQ